MSELFWIILGAAVFLWGGYLVSMATPASRRDMRAYVRSHRYVEPDL